MLKAFLGELLFWEHLDELHSGGDQLLDPIAVDRLGHVRAPRGPSGIGGQGE